MNAKAKRILELEPEQEKLAGTYSESKYWKIQNEINALAFELAREVERDYVRKDRLLGFIEMSRLKNFNGEDLMGINPEKLISAINSGELDKEES